MASPVKRAHGGRGRMIPSEKRTRSMLDGPNGGRHDFRFRLQHPGCAKHLCRVNPRLVAKPGTARRTARPRRSFVPPRRPIKRSVSLLAEVPVRFALGGRAAVERLASDGVLVVRAGSRAVGQSIGRGRDCGVRGQRAQSHTPKCPGRHSSPVASVRRSARPQAPVLVHPASSVTTSTPLPARQHPLVVLSIVSPPRLLSPQVAGAAAAKQCGVCCPVTGALR